MISTDISKLWIISMIITQGSALSFNRPRFCPNASWNPNATTFANSSTIGSNPTDIFISTNNTVYATSTGNNRAVVWNTGNSVPIRNISSNLTSPRGLFVTTTGDIYIDADNSTGRIDKWTWNSTSSIPVEYTCNKCYDVFVDTNDNLYCSMFSMHQVVSKSLQSASNALTIVAGTDANGSASNMLDGPWGIFVDLNVDLYVTDTSNNRIQLFRLGQLNAVTVAGSGSAAVTITLSFPTGIILDAGGYLFIVDRNNHRIVGSGPNGFRCLVGCLQGAGSASNQLNKPRSLSFDSDGNMFVTDQLNNRIQKFVLSTNSCNAILTSTMNNALTTASTIQANQSSTIIPPSNTVTVASSQTVVSYNRPKLCASASWNTNATTFANSSVVGNNSRGIYITTSNTIYVADQMNRRIQVWFNQSTNPTQTIYGNFSSPWSLFVAITGDIYIDNGSSNGKVDRWTANTNKIVAVMYVGSACYGLFVDVKDTLYCSMWNAHQVVSKSLNSNLNTTTIVAGTGCNGSTSNLLYGPSGIFVNTNFDLYVADYYNNRIQLFRLGQLNAVTVVGNRSANVTITLYYPTGIVLDADEYLFIVDRNNHRIVGSGPNGFRCLVGCLQGAGSASNQLNKPQSLSFDSNGNMFVTDPYNNRIQKFVLSTNSCDQYTTSQSTQTSTMVRESTTQRPTESTTKQSARTTTRLPIETTLRWSTGTTSNQSTGATSEQPVEATAEQSTGTRTEEPTETTTKQTVETTPKRSIDTTTKLTTGTTAEQSSESTTLTTMTSGFTSVEPTSAGNSSLPSSAPFVNLPQCSRHQQIGLNCSLSAAPCDTLNPCQNGNCFNDNQTIVGYNCSCYPGYNGSHCQFDHRVCKPDTCWNNNPCHVTANGSFECLCSAGWTGLHCESRINYCENVTCLNNGVCRPLMLDYKCECLGDSSSGRHCEIVARTFVIQQIVSKSVGYAAILFIGGVILFIVIMDVLKYGFGIDPVKDERRMIQQANQAKRRKGPPVIQRFVYVNRPLPQKKTKDETSTVQETSV